MLIFHTLDLLKEIVSTIQKIMIKKCFVIYHELSKRGWLIKIVKDLCCHFLEHTMII